MNLPPANGLVEAVGLTLVLALGAEAEGSPLGLAEIVGLGEAAAGLWVASAGRLASTKKSTPNPLVRVSAKVSILLSLTNSPSTRIKNQNKATSLALFRNAGSRKSAVG